MAGVAIRTYELARSAQSVADVTLAARDSGSTALPDVEVVTYRQHKPTALREHIARADVIVARPQWPTVTQWLRHSGAKLIFDVYDPEPFEVLEFLANRSRVRSLVQTLTIDRFSEAFRIGDHFMCASERQRDLWLGFMLAERAIRPSAYDRDQDLRHTIDTVPFGLPPTPPLATGAGALRAHFGLEAADEVLLWNGGIWNWLDAPVAIRAMAILIEHRPRARLVFMGSSENGPAQRPTREAHAIADQLELTDKHVFFHDGWVPYKDRAAWLLDANCAVSTHREHLETRFAFRTRILDCLWSGLPIVCTGGDDLADRVDRDDLGATAGPADAEGLASACQLVLSRGRDAFGPQLAHAARQFEWPTVAAPLLQWIAEAPPAASRRPSSSRASIAARNVGFRAAYSLLRRFGVEDWPRL
jgi:glycosyltransferase involved in cell wall biosynthesis